VETCRVLCSPPLKDQSKGFNSEDEANKDISVLNFKTGIPCHFRLLVATFTYDIHGLYFPNMAVYPSKLVACITKINRVNNSPLNGNEEI